MKSTAIAVFAGLCASVVPCVALGQGVADAYTLVELQRPSPGSLVYPVALNNSGVSVGYSVNGAIRRPVVFMPDGTVAEIKVPDGSTYAPAIDINDEGAILYRSSSSGTHTLYVRSPTGEHQELAVPSGYGSPYGTAINARGDVVGIVWELPDLFDSVVTTWSLTPSGYDATLIPALPRKIVGAITDSGLIGYWTSQSSSGDGDIYDTRTGNEVAHVWGAQFADITDINNAGHGVYLFDEGASDVRTGIKGLIVGPIFALGCEGSADPDCAREGQMLGNAINEQDVVVGYSNPVLLGSDGWPDGSYGPSTAFIWSTETSSVRLDELVVESDIAGWILSTATDINDVGWIIGKGIKDGEDAAFLLIPREPCAGDVNRDGEVTPTDFTAWINAFNSGCD